MQAVLDSVQQSELGTGTHTNTHTHTMSESRAEFISPKMESAHEARLSGDSFRWQLTE